jgi:hypothetical protein
VSIVLMLSACRFVLSMADPDSDFESGFAECLWSEVPLKKARMAAPVAWVALDSGAQRIPIKDPKPRHFPPGFEFPHTSSFSLPT